MTRRRISLSERFDTWTVPEPNSGCVIWLGAMTGEGYGSIKLEGRVRCAHLINYERVKGSVPKGLELDHRCRVRLCVNPDHLEPVTHKVNVARGLLAEVTRERRAQIRRLKWLEAHTSARAPA